MSFRERKLLHLDNNKIFEGLIEHCDDSDQEPPKLWKKLSKIKDEKESFSILNNQNNVPVLKISSKEEDEEDDIFVKIQNASNGNDDHFDLLIRRVELKQKQITDKTKSNENSEKTFLHFKNLSIMANNEKYYENIINQNKNSFINVTKISEGRPENFYEFEIKKIANYKNKIGLSKRKSYIFQRNFKIFDKIIDCVVDSYNRLYVLSEINDSKELTQLKVIDLNTGFLEVVPYKFRQPNVIETSNSSIFVSDKTNNKKNEIVIFSKTDYHKQQHITDIEGEITDLTVDSRNNLYVLTEDGMILQYPIIPEMPHSQEKQKELSLGDKMTYDFKVRNAEFMTVGKQDDKIYLLFPQNKENNLGFFDIKEKYVQRRKIDLGLEQITSFEVLNSDSIFVTGKNDSGEDAGRQISGSPLHDKISFSFPPDRLFMNRQGDLFTTSRVKDNDESSYEILSIYENKETFFKEAKFVLRPLDSGEIGTRWHRLKIDIDGQSNEAEIEVAYYATDNEENIEKIIGSLRKDTRDIRWSKFPPNPSDALFDAKGRYLWMNVTLKSFDGVNESQIKSISVYFPKGSYLDYLPQVYQEDEKSKKFLEDFVSLFEAEFDAIDEKINSFGKILDVQATPNNFLPWIASWLAINYQEGWPNQNLRNLLKKTPDLMKHRGTKESLEEILKIFLTENYTSSPKESTKNLKLSSDNTATDNLDGKIWIFEHFQLKRIFANMKKDDNYKNQYQEYVNLFGVDPFSFFVLLDSSILNEDKLRVVHDIVEKEKPAYTVGHVCVLRPWFVLGRHTYLGINSKIVDKRFVIEDLAKNPLIENQSVLDRNSIIQ